MNDKLTKYALSKLTKVKDDVDNEKDVTMNAWEYLIPDY